MNVPKAKVLTSAMLLAFASGLSADDGLLQIRNVSKTPDWETHHATLEHLNLYVPAQVQPGELITVLYEPVIDDIGEFVLERSYARPLVALYEDGPAVHPEDSAAFYGHGERDFYAATSLDDGATWNRVNLSDSADKSSIRVDNDGIPEEWDGWYRGDVFRNFTASAENKVLAVWASRYCDSGNPTYSMEISEIEDVFASEYVDLSNLGDPEACTDDDADPVGPDDDPTVCLYFEDYWHVAGSQQIKDFTEEEFPTVGEVPYACLWTARGTLELNDDGLFEMVWRKAERLTSGLRDVHRMEAAAVPGAGWVVTWQEDPEGLRPGKGEGPGEGWSGAIAHHETDIWYSFIDWDNFDLVRDGDEIVPLAAYDDDGAPKVGVPMSIPVRLTDNAVCTVPDEGEQADDPYCYIDFDETGTADNCAIDVMYDIVTPEGPIQTVQMCVAEDGRLMRGNTGSARARTNLRGYDSDNDGLNDSAWVIFAYEEHKGLGEEEDIDPLGTVDKVDMGKNIWYHTFDMFNPELVSQGLMLNQPAIYPRDIELGTLDGYTLTPVDATAYTDYAAGGDFMIVEPDPVYSEADLESTLYQTEIARRYSQITQPASKAGDSGMVALAMYKQGIVRQGGPADVFARRFVIEEPCDDDDDDNGDDNGDEECFDPTTDNPFDYANMECEDWLFTDGSNPRYVKGLCLSTPQNLSGTVPVNCDEGIDACAANLFPYDDLIADIDKSDDPGGLPKMIEWRMCQADGQTFQVHSAGGDVTSFTCPNSNLNDQSWENPWDLAKGHRGFMKGDFIMQMYAWSPNWEAQVEGHDNYNLYVRRSFDGGVTWTTLPSAGIMEVPEGVEVVADGTFACEWYGIPGATTEYAVCWDYAAGEYEQARNLSQLVGTVDTVLDPRFAPTPPTILACLVESADEDLIVELENPCQTYEELPYPDDFTDPSKYFATFEIGDASDVALGGEPVPLDMAYARHVNYGDDIEVADTNADGIANIDPNETEDFEVFDKLEWHDPHASEAALKANPGGTLFYAIWNEALEGEEACLDTTGGGRSSGVAAVSCNSDAVVRRTMELGDLYVTTPTGGDEDGGEPNDDPPGGGGPGDGDDDDDERPRGGGGREDPPGGRD
jgi:hypothetical protein